MADAKSPMQKQREQRRSQGWRDVNIWLTPEGQERIARLMEPGESLSMVIDRALMMLDKAVNSRTSEATSDQAEDLQALISREVSRYFTSDGFRDNLFIPVLKQALSSYFPSDLTRYRTSEPITVQALPASRHAAPVRDERAEVLQRIRSLQAEGLSLQAIANRLNAEGVPTSSGRGSWKKGTISNLLKEESPDESQ